MKPDDKQPEDSNGEAPAPQPLPQTAEHDQRFFSTETPTDEFGLMEDEFGNSCIIL